MPGIANNTSEELRARIESFSKEYVIDWNCWLGVQEQDRANALGLILRRWQACRPNSMRRVRAEADHDAPFLEELIECAAPQLKALEAFDIRLADLLNSDVCDAILQLWDLFAHLSYSGTARNGLAGVVGISKATMLLTNGRVGPAFDSRVRRNLVVGEIANGDQWLQALRIAQCDIRAFEQNTGLTLQSAVPDLAHLNSGRIYDMALGPPGRSSR